MWKTVGAAVLRYGAVYCVFGVAGIVFFLVPHVRALRRRGGQDEDSPPPSS